jgi:predicted O-methyltransferase YrrM
MSLGGTDSYRTAHSRVVVPDLVMSAVSAAEELEFDFCVRPELGRLLAVLAGGLPPRSHVGETGTGTGAGLAWMATAADPTVRFVSFERDTDRATAAQRLFADHENVEIVCGDSDGLLDRGPFDLLVHDGGGGSGKQSGDDLIDPTTLLRPGGTMTVDDYTPAVSWPPTFRGEPDHGRIRLLAHPELRCTEIRVAPDLAMLVARNLPRD